MVEPRFLVVRLGSLGDIVHTFPAVAGLRQSFPRAEIIWLTHPKWEALVHAANLVDEVWTVETRDWSSLPGILARIRRHHFDVAIDYQGLWKSASIPFFAGIPRRVGFSSETIRETGVHLLYNERVRVKTASHLADQNSELSLRAGATQATGEVAIRALPEDETSVRQTLRNERITQYIVLSPGGGWRSKCWPAERYGQLAEKIGTDFHLPCVINAGPGEEDLVDAVKSASGSAHVVTFTGSLGELMALLKHTRAVVAGDTGPLHLADALAAPLVALFGPTDPARNGPYWRNGMVLRWEGAATTYKRGSVPDESLLHISVDEVMSALRGLRASA